MDVPPERLLGWIDRFADRHGPFERTAGPETVVLVAADGARAEIAVPFPPLAGARIADLLAHVHRPRRVGVLLVRRGGHAAGVFEGADLVSSKVGSSYVQGTTKAGGSSQKRYSRRRDNQADAAFARATEVAVRILGDVALDALVAGGDRPAVRSVLADPRLTGPAALLTDPWLQVKDPRLRVLEATPRQFLAVRISVLDPQPAGPPAPLRLDVDGELFDVTGVPDRPGEYRYTWLTGPDAGYGFAERRSDGEVMSRAGMAEAIRTFLDRVDPDTGHIE